MYVGLTIVFLLHVANSFNFMTERVAYLVSIVVMKGFLGSWQKGLHILWVLVSWKGSSKTYDKIHGNSEYLWRQFLGEVSILPRLSVTFLLTHF